MAKQQTKTATATADPSAAKEQTTALAKEPRARVSGTYSDPRLIDQHLRRAADEAHLVAPSTIVGSLPAGCEVALAVVYVRADDTETYPIPGGQRPKRGLSKVALDRIAAAAGLSWDPSVSRRLDDGRDPSYVHYLAVGWYRAFDGSRVYVQGEKEMDVREGSPAVLALHEKARAKGNDATRQIRELRLHIMAHAETKARLRAIRAMGIRTSYDVDELRKPFVVARVVFTGHTDDPALKRLFAEKTADAFLGASTTLYGPPALPPGPPPGTVRSAPALPSGTARALVPPDDLDEDLGLADAPGVIDTTATTSTSGTAAPTPAKPPDTSLSLPHKADEPAKPVREATDRDLGHWRNVLADKLDNATSQFPELDTPLLAAIEFEVDRRRAVVAASSDPAAPPGAQLPLGGAKPEPGPQQ